jgi:hypothetical protein
MAHKQGAKTLELRARTSLAKLFRGHEKEEQVIAEFAVIFNQLTEGFDG